MRFDWVTFALQTVNFVILVWLLHRFLYRPVLRLIDARRAEIDQQFASARAIEDKAKAQLAAAASERVGIVAERAELISEAVAHAEEQAQQRRKQAEKEAAALLASARATLAAERREALAEARAVALDLGAEIAGKFLAEMPMQQRGEAWLDHIGKYLTSLPVVQRGELAAQLVNGAELTVTTASALPAETAKAWREQLQKVLGKPVNVGFATDPHLIAGAELHFPHALLRFSWQSTLEAMRHEMAGRGDDC